MCIAFLQDECSNLNLPVSKLLFENAMNDIPESSRELKILFDCLIYELKAQLFLFLPPHLAKYYELALPGIITSSFPTAGNELIAAGNTLATRFYTACVFHSMRGAEIGVRALGAALGVTFPNKPLELAEWQIILDQADSKIIAMKNMRSGTCKDEELKFYSQAGVQFRYFKDAWRVRVAHARETYEESHAVKIFNHTIEFFETLATRLEE